MLRPTRRYAGVQARARISPNSRFSFLHEAPTSVDWYTSPETLLAVLGIQLPGKGQSPTVPLGNGRLSAMVFGRTDEEEIQINEDTYWSGGPYSTTVRGAKHAVASRRHSGFISTPASSRRATSPRRRRERDRRRPQPAEVHRHLATLPRCDARREERERIGTA